MAASADDPLVRLARELLRADGPARRPLGELLAAHPEAAAQLTEALLEAEIGRDAAEQTGERTADVAPDHGETIGPYTLRRVLGRGGQAIVYEALDPRLGRRVALKVLRADVFGSHAAKERFRAEAATTSRLDHPGICPVFEIGEAGDVMYLAMRFLDGQTLAQRIAAANGRAAAGQRYELFAGEDSSARAATTGGPRRVRPWLATLDLFESAAQALHAAHVAGVAHRDVKPGNVMVQPDGRAVLLDFGLAGDVRRDGESLTRSGEVFGTPAYMAPEQCRDARAADFRSDIWALGASLYEALTGCQAFDGPTPEAKVRRILQGRVPDPRRIVRGLPWELAVVVGKAMDPDPARRYVSAAAFAEDLVRLRESRPILARPPSPLLRAQRWLQRNPLLAALVAVSVGGVVVTESLRRTASAATRDREYLGVPQRLVELQLEAEQLRPLREQRVKAEQWLEAARLLVSRRAEFVARLAELRRTAAPPTEAEVADMQRRHPATEKLRQLGEIDASVQARLGHPETVTDLANETGQRVAEAEHLRAELAAARSYRFEDPGSQVLHDSLVAFLARLDEFATASGPLATVERELRELAAEAPADWAAATKAIAASDLYGHLTLRPQGGLSPLRCNPRSGLWEFLHLRSGKAPQWRADGSVIIAEDTGIVLALVPGGRYRVGSQKRDPAGDDYYPQQLGPEDYWVEVPLEPWFLAVHEVTQAQWQRLAGDNPSMFPPVRDGESRKFGVTALHPVENVPWPVARSVLQQVGLTLPTETQWEVAARGGKASAPWNAAELRRIADEENVYDQRAKQMELNAGGRPPHDRDDGFAVHAPVASFRPNAWGFHDVLGNVMEWCLDTEAWPNHHLLRAGDGMWLSPPSAKHALRGGGFTSTLERSLLFLRTSTADVGYFAGIRAARRVD